MSCIQQERYHYIDATKGVAILCIALMHFEDGVFPTLLNVWTGLFMIAAFYFTSGWLTGFKDSQLAPKQLFGKRLRQLGIPYMWFVLLILGFELLLVLMGEMETKLLFRDMYCAVTLRGIGTLWFLPVLMLGEWLFCVIRCSRYKYLLALTLLVVTCVTSDVYYNIWMKFRDLDDWHRIIDAPIRPIVMSFQAWPIIGIGYLCGKYLGRPLLRIGTRWQIAVGVSLLAVSAWLVIGPIFHIDYLNDTLSRTLPALGFVCIFMAVRGGILLRFFTFWGRNSLILLGTHYSFTLVLFQLFDDKVLHHTTFSGGLTLVYFALAILASYPMVTLFNGRLRFMLGKN